MTLVMGMVMKFTVRAALMITFLHRVGNLIRGVLEPDDPSVFVEPESPPTRPDDVVDREMVPSPRDLWIHVRVENDRTRNHETDPDRREPEPFGHGRLPPIHLRDIPALPAEAESLDDDVVMSGGLDQSSGTPRVYGGDPFSNCVIKAAVPHIHGNITSLIRAQPVLIIRRDFFFVVVDRLGSRSDTATAAIPAHEPFMRLSRDRAASAARARVVATATLDDDFGRRVSTRTARADHGRPNVRLALPWHSRTT